MSGNAAANISNPATIPIINLWRVPDNIHFFDISILLKLA